MGVESMTPRERILRRVEVDPDTGCWNWTGHKTPTGYGIISINRKNLLVHRVMCDGLEPHLFACHTCDNRSCCNPDHLFPGTNQDNVDDKMAKGRHVRPSQWSGDIKGSSPFRRADVEIIHMLKFSGLNSREIQELYPDVTARSIRRILSGDRWPEVYNDFFPKKDGSSLPGMMI